MSYKITHPDLIEKIRSFLKATAAQGIKIVPISVAVIAVIHGNRNLTMLEIGGGTLMVDNLPALKKTLVKSAVKGATVALVFVGGGVLITTPAGRMALSLINLITRRTIMPVINVDTLDKAEKMLSEANLLNEDEFNVSPKEPSIPIRNN